MSTHKNIDRICAAVTALTVIIAFLFCNGSTFGLEHTVRALGYENRIFDNSRVHTFDIVIDDWDSFIESCPDEVYSECTVVIDGEAFKNAAIRGKGNTSLSSVKNMDSDRYSFKVEFDHYDKNKSYYGLDKLCLNNIIQDNTYMKDYLAYTMMGDFGVSAPMCSYAYITVNGEDWGLYLAVEAVEESFLERNYGSSYGELYKPDSMSNGGGPGNGKNFGMPDLANGEMPDFANGEMPDLANGEMPDFANGEMPDLANGEKTDSANKERSAFGERKMEGTVKEETHAAEIVPESSDTAETAESSDDKSDASLKDVKTSDNAVSPAVTGEATQATEEKNNMDSAGRDRQDHGMRGNFQGGGDSRGGGPGGGMGSDDVKLKYTDDNEESYSNIFGNAKTDITDADKKRLISSLKALYEQTDLEKTVDIEKVIRYFVVHNFVCNGDSYTGQMIHNYYLYEDNGKLSMIPWDYNLAFGTFQAGEAYDAVNEPIDTPVSDDMSSRPMVAWIFDSNEYTEKYHQLFSEFTDCTDLEKTIDETAELIDSYVEKDPGKFCTYEEFLAGAEALKMFCTLRTESVRGQLDGTIPSTSEDQTADSSALIETGDLVLSDLGTMNMGKGGKEGMGGPDGAESRKGASGDNFEMSPMNDTELQSGSDEEIPENFIPSQMFGNAAPGNAAPGNAAPGSAASGNAATENETDQNANTGQRGGMRQANGGGFGQMPEGENFGGNVEVEESSTASYIILGVCVLVLTGGLTTAFKYRRRK